MSQFLLEDVWKLAICLGALQFLLLCVWSKTRSRRVAIANWITLASIPILCSLSVLVTTPTEQVIETCRTVARAIDTGDMQNVAVHVANDFRAGELDRDQLLEKLERALTRVRVDKPRLRRFEVAHTTPTTSEAIFRVSCRIRTPQFTRNGLPSKWRINFRRGGDAWRITEIESLPVPPLNIRHFGNWLR